MVTRSKEVENAEDANLTEEERLEKEQRELVPLLTSGKLKSYQIKGVKWMISLWQNGLNGILADQMGLGKTIQTIGFLAHLKGNGLDGPYLVIAPLSTLSNWVNEISRFAPSINAIIYHGDKKQRDDIRRKYMPRSIGPKFPIIVTSYEIAFSDAKKCLRHYNWKYAVIDEGHRLKNSKCKLLKELKHIPMENKLLLTGTPLQNNLAELWSLLNFILPDIFQSHDEFESWLHEYCCMYLNFYMKKRAFSKLKLEHVVIGKGQFHQERTKANAMNDLEEEDILALLRDKETVEDKLIQTDISDDDLERALDRSDLIGGPADSKENGAVCGIPLKGPGWEVVIPTATGGMLSALNS